MLQGKPLDEYLRFRASGGDNVVDNPAGKGNRLASVSGAFQASHLVPHVGVLEALFGQLQPGVHLAQVRTFACGSLNRFPSSVQVRTAGFDQGCLWPFENPVPCVSIGVPHAFFPALPVGPHWTGRGTVETCVEIIPQFLHVAVCIPRQFGGGVEVHPLSTPVLL